MTNLQIFENTCLYFFRTIEPRVAASGNLELIGPKWNVDPAEWPIEYSVPNPDVSKGKICETLIPGTFSVPLT